MNAQDVTTLWIAAAMYLAGAVLAWIGLIWRKERPLSWAQVLLAAGLAMQGFSIGARWLRVGHGPYINAIEVLSSSVWTGLAALAILAWRVKPVRAAFGPALSVCVLLLGWAILTDPAVMPLPPTFRSVWLIAHVLAAKLAFGAILIASGLAVVHLCRAPRAETGAPSEAMTGNDTQSYRLVAFGFIFVGFMIVAGAIWAREAWGSYWSWDPIETWSLVTWLSYGLLLHLRLTFGVRGRTWAGLVLGLLCLSVFCFFVAGVISKTVHVEFMGGARK